MIVQNKALVVPLCETKGINTSTFAHAVKEEMLGLSDVHVRMYKFVRVVLCACCLVLLVCFMYAFVWPGMRACVRACICTQVQGVQGGHVCICTFAAQAYHICAPWCFSQVCRRACSAVHKSGCMEKLRKEYHSNIIVRERFLCAARTAHLAPARMKGGRGLSPTSGPSHCLLVHGGLFPSHPAPSMPGTIVPVLYMASL